MQNFRIKSILGITVLSEMIKLKIGACCKLCKWSFHCAGFTTRRQHFASDLRYYELDEEDEEQTVTVKFIPKLSSRGQSHEQMILPCKYWIFISFSLTSAYFNFRDVLLIWQNKPHGACANTCDLFNSDSVCQFAQCVHLRPRTGDITIHMLVLPLRLFRIKVYAHRTWWHCAEND